MDRKNIARTLFQKITGNYSVVSEKESEDENNIMSLQPGETGIICAVHSFGAIRQRLLDMGLVPGAKIKVERIAPVGDPIWIRIHDGQLALRKAEAEAIVLHEKTDENGRNNENVGEK